MMKMIPIPQKVLARTIASELVSVKPMEPIPNMKSKYQQLKEDRMNKLKKINGESPDVKLPYDTWSPWGYYKGDFKYD